MDPDPANEERAIAWSKEYWRKLHPYSAGGAYVKKNATGISNPACTDDLLVGEGDGTAVSGCSCACSGVAVLETCGVFSVKRC